MYKLAQVIARAGCGCILRGTVLLALPALASCGSPTPPAIPVKPMTEAVPPLPPADFGEIRGHPLNDWTYADSLEELHAVWEERFTLSAARDLDARTLWPYADAVLLDGDSWGIAPKATQLFYKDSGGHAYRVSGAGHPTTGSGPMGEAIDLETLAAAGWTDVNASGALVRTKSGSGFRIAAPLRAAASCLECHDFTAGATVAMLVYDFQEIPDD